MLAYNVNLQSALPMLEGFRDLFLVGTNVKADRNAVGTDFGLLLGRCLRAKYHTFR